MKLRDIPQFTRDPNYAVDISFDYLETHLARWEERGNLELEPDFQRAHVWTQKQQSAYVEYILQGGRAGRELFFNCKGWMRGYEGTVQLVDGLQRLTAVRGFMASKVPAFGNLYSEFEDELGFSIGFKFYVNSLETRAEVLQWYLDLNTGGTVHTSAEIEKVKILLVKEKA